MLRMDKPTPTLSPQVTLQIRSDGSLHIAQGDRTIECVLRPAQWLQWGIDCLRVATELDRDLYGAALLALQSTNIDRPLEVEACRSIN